MVKVQNKDEFIKAVKLLVENYNTLVIDAVLEVADKFNVDMDTAGKIIKGNPELQQALEKQCKVDNLLKK